MSWVWFLNSRLGRGIGLVVAFFGACWTILLLGRKQGKEKLKRKMNEDYRKRMEAGRDAMESVDPTDRGKLVDQLRKNGDEW